MCVMAITSAAQVSLYAKLDVRKSDATPRKYVQEEKASSLYKGTLIYFSFLTAFLAAFSAFFACFRALRSASVSTSS